MYTYTKAYSCMNPIGHRSFQFHPFYLDIMSQLLCHHEVCLLLVPGRSRLPHWRLRLPSLPAFADKDAPSRLPRQMLEWSESFSKTGVASSPRVFYEAHPPSLKAGACQVLWILRSCRGNFRLGRCTAFACYDSHISLPSAPPTPQPQGILTVLSNPPEWGLLVCWSPCGLLVIMVVLIS